MKTIEYYIYITSSKYSINSNNFTIIEFNLSNNIELRKQDFLSVEKISHPSRFVIKDVSQSH